MSTTKKGNYAVNMLDAALWYAKALGWHIFPCHEPLFNPDGDCVGCTCEQYRQSDKCKDNHPHLYLGSDGKCNNPGKCPRVRWKDKATNDANQITQWWGWWPNANIGWIPGNDDYAVLDADSYKDTYDGDDLLTQDEQQTITAITGSGGEHLVYSAQGKTYSNSPGDLPDGVDVRAHSGYVIIAPSMHSSGNRYRWEEGFAPHEIKAIPLPDKIKEKLQPQRVGSNQTAEIKDSDNLISDIVVAAQSLNQLDAKRRDDYNEWINVGLSLRGLGDTGLKLWEDWSKKSSKYKNGDCGQKWASFFANGHMSQKIGLGSLVVWAREDKPQTTEEPIQLSEPVNQSSTDFDVLKYRAEDGGILDAWVEWHKHKWMYVTGVDMWHLWNITHWTKDDNLVILKEVRELTDLMNTESKKAIRKNLDRHQDLTKKLADLGSISAAESKEMQDALLNVKIAESMASATKRTKTRISSIEGMARSDVAIPVSSLNNQSSLNLRNGVLNLSSLELIEHDKKQLFTYCLDYEYDKAAGCPLFEKFLSEIFVKEGTTDPDNDLILLIQELLGYSLTPNTSREVMVWMFGEGGNGKSVALSVIEALLGPMALNIDFHTVGLPGNYDLADLPGKRVLFSSEAERGGSIAEGYIKKIVTGDTIRARPIYGSPIEFKSTAKIWWAMNNKPVIKDTSDAIWRRLKLIPFYRKFEEGHTADPKLTEKLLQELPGILNWAIQGMIRLHLNEKFTVAESAEMAKAEYRVEANPVAAWVATMTIHTDQPATLQAGLYKEFKEWSINNGEKIISSNQFGRELKRLKILSTRRNTGQMYNLALITNTIIDKSV